ncbi:hypothetical protein AB0O76_16045 [Streptomyces sp. NPDC086554]|uniref:hypothetical protein n=1 Tax=Streptomyces sp. NPDC086554 TaxID=3154864 RepID=UPI00342DDD8F
MAIEEPNPALPTPAHPLAKPGYGKHSVPGQARRREGDFAHLPVREAYLAAYIDRLPEGAAIDIKTLAREQPRYGQQAVQTALNSLTAAGHYRRVRVPLGDALTQWVFRTYFSRTARDAEWWTRFLTGDVPDGDTDTVPDPSARKVRSEAYDALARLGTADNRLTLSAAECAALEELAAQWLARGATREGLTRALTAGLPDQVHSPGAFVRRRLRDKLPPQLAARRQVLVECTGCGVPGLPERLPYGLCKGCRGQGGGTGLEQGPATALPPHEVRRRVAALRSRTRL